MAVRLLRLILKKCGDLGHGESLRQGVVAAAGADEIAQEGAGVDGLSEVAGEGTDVGAFGAADADFRKGKMEGSDVDDVDAAVFFLGSGNLLLVHSAIVRRHGRGVCGRTVGTEVQKFEFVDADV